MKTKSTRKRLLAVLVAIALASVLFAGCGNKQQAQEQPKADTTEVAAVSEAAEEQVDVSEAQPEDETSAEAEVAEETEAETSGLDVDSMSFEWTEDTELFFYSQWGYWLVYKDGDTAKFAVYDVLPQDDTQYSREELQEIEIRHFVLAENSAIAEEEIDIIKEIVDVYFSNNYASIYNIDDELAKQWCPWNIASYTDGTVTYEMTLSEEDEAVHARKIENGEVVQEYDTETSLKLARKIIKDLIPEVTIE